MNRNARHTVQSIALAGTLATLTLGVIAPTVAQAASIAPATTVDAAAPATARESQPTGRMGVWANIYNRSGKATIWVKNRDTGQTFELKPKQSQAFDSEFTTVADEIELTIQHPGQKDFDIDIANPTTSWPNVTVDGDNENFSEWETQFFKSGDSRIEVQRHNDRDNRKRFYINITPPGPVQPGPTAPR